MALKFNPTTGKFEDDTQAADAQAADMFAMNIPRSAPAGLPEAPDVPAPPLPTPQDTTPAPLVPTPAPVAAPAPPPPPMPTADTMPAAMPSPALPAPAPTPAPAPAPKMPGNSGGGGAPSEGKLMRDLQRIQADEQQATEQRGDVAIQRAGIEQQVADRQAQLAQEAENRRAALEQAAEAEVAKKQAALDAESEKYKSMGFKDFWSRASIAGKEGTTTGARVLGAISMALGAAGAGLAHMPNYAQDIIDKAIDRDYQLQKDTILKQKDVVTEARMGVEGARQAKADKLLALENWRKSAYEQAAAQAKSMLAKMGVPEAEAEKNALVATQRQKAFDSQQDLRKGIATLANLQADTVLKRAEAAKSIAEAKAKGTEGQDDKGRAAGKQIELATMASQMLDDIGVIKKTGMPSAATLQKIQENETALKAVSDSHGVKGALGAIVGRQVGIVPKNRLEGIPPDQQRAVNSWDLLAKKAATVLSGQGHANVESTMAMMMPKPEDSPEVKLQKLENLQHIAENAQVLSGKYGQRIQAADAARGATAAPASSNRQQVLEASQWLQANPNDPRAPAVRRKIAELSAGGL